MSIGSTIKRLRREKGITQEELAEYLGITSRAVSQWERERTSPDISALPALCHIFDVSADVLLEIDVDKSAVEIKNYLLRAEELGNLGRGAERTALLREANKKFPRDYTIMHRLADSLVCEYSRQGGREYEEVFSLCNRVLAECTDSVTRYETIETLGVAYGCAGKTDEMLKLAEEMPRAQFSYESFMMYRWQGDADFAKRQSYTSYLITELFESIDCASLQRHDDGRWVYSPEEQLRLEMLRVALLELLFSDGDYHFFAQEGELACRRIAKMLLRSHDVETAWKWIEKAADFAIHMDTYAVNASHTSPILRGYASGGWIMEKEGNHSHDMLVWLTTADDTASLRSDMRLTSLISRLKPVARKV